MVSESGSRTSSYGSVKAILPLLEYLENAGFDLKAILERAGISQAALEGTRTRFPKRKFQALWQVASEATGDPAIALRVSTMVKTNTLGIIGYLASASDSRRNAFELVKGMTPLLWEDVECDLESDEEIAFLRCCTDRSPQASRITTEYAIGLTVTMSRVLGTGHFDPLEARFSYPAPAYADEYERILRLPVRFDAGDDGVLFPISMMDTLNPSADAALRQLLQRYAAEQLARIPTSARFSQRVLKRRGAEIVDPADVPNVKELGDPELEVLLHEFKAGLEAYLASLGPKAPVKTLADVIAFNERNREREMPFFGQELFLKAQEKGPLSTPAYEKALETCARLSRKEGLDAVLDRHRLDALVAPTGAPAWVIDPVSGDHFVGGHSTPAAVSGYPSLTVPMGFVFGLPVGLSFIGRAWSEPVLVRLDFAFEQATKHRRPPRFLRTADIA